MLKHIFLTSLFLFSSLNASAAFIYANDFTVGQNVSQLTSNATLSWLSGTGNSSQSYIASPGSFYNQHFGGLTSATTANTFPGLYQEGLGSPLPQIYTALEISFTSAVRSFGFKAENLTSSPFGVFLYDTSGNFLKMLSANVIASGKSSPQSEYAKIFDASYIYNFDVDIGKIRIGGASDGGYIYALDVDVPEPSSLALLFAGLLSITLLRRTKPN